jgi:hypothetical protein
MPLFCEGARLKVRQRLSHARSGEKRVGAVTQEALACPLGGKKGRSGNARGPRIPAREKKEAKR